MSDSCGRERAFRSGLAVASRSQATSALAAPLHGSVQFDNDSLPTQAETVATTGRPPCDEAVILTTRGRRISTTAGNWVLGATILGSSMAFIDGTVVNVALAALQSDLRATVADVQWVVEAYALSLAALLLTGGSLGDLYGRRRIFTIGVALFAAASVWCGFAADIRELILARGLQGVGAALLVPGSLALISASFPPEQRGRAIGVWSGFTAITAAIGPVLGGWIVESASWRWVFFINLPLALVIIALSLWHVPESSAEDDRRRLDVPGALLASVGLTGIVFALIEFPNRQPAVPVAGVIGLIACIVFPFAEARSPAPMVPLALFRSRDFSGANLLTLLLYTALSGALFFFPLALIQVQGYSATQAGAALLPFIFLMFALSRWSGGLVSVSARGSRLSSAR
jgi:EmrB/QacA subfamily drug resistance transporter